MFCDNFFNFKSPIDGPARSHRGFVRTVIMAGNFSLCSQKSRRKYPPFKSGDRNKSNVLLKESYKKEKLYPYYFILVQKLPQNPPARLRFSQFLQTKQNEDQTLPDKILFTDEATFTEREVFNWRNSHL